MWRTPDPVPLCPLCPVFFRNTPYSHCPVENAHCHRGASPFRPYSRCRYQRGDTAVRCEQKEYLSLARATQWCKKTLRLFALAHQFLQQLIEGDELYTRVHKKVGPDESQGWTVVLMDRATRFLWDMHCGRKNRQMLKKAMSLLCQVIEQTGDLTLLTDGERRYGSLLFELCSQALRTGKRGHPKKTLPKASKCGSRIKDHKGISAGANAPSIKPRIQNIPTRPSLLPPQRFMPIIWKPSIPRCADVVRPIAGALICMLRRQDDSKKG